jgi:hypothetical protein
MALPKELTGRAEMLNSKFTFFLRTNRNAAFTRQPLFLPRCCRLKAAFREPWRSRFPKIFVRFPQAAGLY